MAVFAHHEAQIVSASDKFGRINDEADFKDPIYLVGHNSPISCIDISRDNQFIVTSSQDGTAILWSAKTGEALSELSGHIGPVFCAAFSIDGKRIVTAGQDGTVRIWLTHLADLISVAEKAATNKLTCFGKQLYLRETKPCQDTNPS
jgi:WD40 repeat protein